MILSRLAIGIYSVFHKKITTDIAFPLSVLSIHLLQNLKTLVLLFPGAKNIHSVHVHLTKTDVHMCLNKCKLLPMCLIIWLRVKHRCTLGCTKMHESQNIMGADSQNRLLYSTKSLQKELGFFLQNCGTAQFLDVFGPYRGKTAQKRSKICNFSTFA